MAEGPLRKVVEIRESPSATEERMAVLECGHVIPDTGSDGKKRRCWGCAALPEDAE